jgi:hypothetical protein
MADGSEVLAPIFLGSIRFPQLDDDVAVMVGVTVTVLGDQAMIGLRNCYEITFTQRLFMLHSGHGHGTTDPEAI